MNPEWEKRKYAEAAAAKKNNKAEANEAHKRRVVAKIGFFVSRHKKNSPYVVQILDATHEALAMYKIRVGDVLYKIGGTDATEFSSDVIEDTICDCLEGTQCNSTQFVGDRDHD